LILRECRHHELPLFSLLIFLRLLARPLPNAGIEHKYDGVIEEQK
jgi:hypothetical protein